MKGLLSANLKAHSARYRATTIAVALAVAFILTAFGLTGALQYSMKATVASNVLGANGIITDLGFNTDDAEESPGKAILDALQKDSKIGAEPIYREFDEVRGSGQATSVFLGVGQVRQEPFDNPELTEGEFPAAANEVALPDIAKQNLSIAVGDKVRVIGPNKDFTVTGFTEIQNGLSLEPRILFLNGEVDKLYPQGLISEIVFKVDGMNDEAATKYVASIIDSLNLEENKISVLSSQQYVEKALEDVAGGMAGVLAVLLVFPGIAGVTAIIVISTTFQVMLAQRKRELALLRAVGADARQIRRLMIAENLLVGLIASFIGILLGTISATAINKLSSIVPNWFEAFKAIPIWGYIAALLIGLLITLIAGIRPAFQAGSLSPMVALAPVESAAVQKSKRLARLISGLVITTLGIGIIALAASSDGFGKEGAEFGLSFLGGFVSFIGALILLTWLVPYITAGVGKLIGRSSVTFEMAGGNTWRNPARTGATGTALILGITLVTMMMVGAKSVESSVLTEIDDKRPIDLIISSEEARTLTDAEVQAVRNTNKVEQVVVAKSFIVTTEATPDGEPLETAQFVEETDLSQVAHSQLPAIQSGTIAVNGWLVTDEETLQFAAGGQKMSFTVEAARTPHYTLNKADYQALRKMYGDEATDTSIAFARVSTDMTLTEVNTLYSDITEKVSHASIDGSAGERAAMMLAIKSMLVATIVMLGVSVLVALVGVTNTLALSVVERRRENAMLRALGMTKGDLWRMITWETVLIAGIAILVGVVLGISYGALGMWSLPLELDASRDILVPWDQVGIAALISLLAALLASIMPARQASKATPVEALADIG